MYNNGNSVIHKLNPVFKIISFILMLIGIFFVDSYKDIIMLGSYLILSIVYSEIKLKSYLKNIYSIRIIFILIFIIDLIFYRGINIIIYDWFKLIFIIEYISIITYCTPITEITYGIERILRPFNKIMPINNISLIIMLIIKFIPTISENYYNIIKVEKQRGININKMYIKEKYKYKLGVIKKSIYISLHETKKTIDVMELRLYNYGKSRSNYRFNKWKKTDSLLLILNILILIIVISY